MNLTLNRSVIILAAAAALLIPGIASADLTTDSHSALRQLVANNPAARKLQAKAVAVLVFPHVTKAGFIFGGQVGEGTLFRHGSAGGRYRTIAGSYGLQAGVQQFGYALFFMNRQALNWLNKTDGFEIGTGPSVVVLDQGMARTFSSNTLHSGIYAITFDQRGLMAGLGLQGTKITRIGN
jgi:lipid-binding SYLF domain-containing protein